MLNGTTAKVAERKALRINPAKTCQPIGAMYASLGIHGCMPHSHGSQGCCAYHRSHLTRHYKEPVMSTTSSFTEGTSVFGGLANLKTALLNIFSIYNPEMVAVHTTCLSEVIGDDIPSIVKEARDNGNIPEGKIVIHANTPSFVGSNTDGFANMCEAFVKYLAEKSGEAKDVVNVFPGWVEPSDMREMKRLASAMGVNVCMYPDTSGVLDAPQTGMYEMYPRGGAKIEDIKASGDSIKTLACGFFSSNKAAVALEKKCEVPFDQLEIPIGLSQTDAYVNALRLAAQVDVPSEIDYERGQLLDLISDLAQYFHNKRVAIFGDPDTTISMAKFVSELGMIPAFVITGAQSKRFEKRVKDLLGDKAEGCEIHSDTDLFSLHQWIKNEPVDLLLGNTYGKHMARAEGNIPFVRFGFPILDRATHRFMPQVGYRGALRMADQIFNALLDKHDRETAEEYFELIQ